jgi:hypothetical protein
MSPAIRRAHVYRGTAGSRPIEQVVHRVFPKLCKSGNLSYALVMANDSILSLVDAELARLTQIRTLLADAGKVVLPVTEPKAKKAPAKAKTKKKRVLSPEARKRIADAQHKRWAAQKSKAKSK